MIAAMAVNDFLFFFSSENDFFLGCSFSCAETIIFVSGVHFEEYEHFSSPKG